MRRRLLFLSAALLALLHPLRAFQSVTSDDAFIAFRYAKHLAAGLGLVWNPGEPPLEGFTSILHVLLLAGGIRAGLDPLLLSQILGLAGSLLSCLGAAWIAAELSGNDPRPAPLAALGLALATPLAVWARGGLETTIFTGLLSLAAASYLRQLRLDRGRWAPALIFFVAGLSRPEAVAVAGVALIHDGASRARHTGLLSAAGRTLASWWPYPLLMGVYAGWKLHYFGSLLPNTYYAKAAGGLFSARAGLAYAASFLLGYGVVNLLLAALPLAFFPSLRPAAVSFLLASMGVIALQVIRVGGDYSYFGRYLVPILPMLLALSAAGAVQLWDRAGDLPRPRRMAAALIVIAVSSYQLSAGSLRELRDRPFLLGRPWRLVEPIPAPGDPYASLFRPDYILMGKAMHEQFPREGTIGCMAVGAIGYYSERPIFDLLGINDRRIARLPVEAGRFESWSTGHMKGSAAEVLSRRPEYLLLDLHSTGSRRLEPPPEIRRKYPFVDDLLKSPEFHALYRLESCRLPDGRWMNYYRRDGASPVACDSGEASSPPPASAP